MFIGASVYRSKGIGGGFPVDCITVRPYAKAFTASNFLQLSTSLCRSMTFHHHHYPPSIHPLCRYSVLGQLGRQFLDNLYARRTKWLSTMDCRLCQMHFWPTTMPLPSYRILATDSQGQQDKTPNIQKPAYPCPSGPQYTDKDKIQTEERKREMPILACRNRTTISIF